MMKRHLLTLLLLISLGLSGFGTAKETDKLLLNDAGVSVYMRPVSGLPLGEIRATGEFDATPEEVFTLLWDIPSTKDFMSLIKDAENISLSKTARVDHIIFSGSFPGVKDRDVVSETKIKVKNEKKISFQYKQVEGVGPAPSKDMVRLTLREGGWEFIAIDNGTRTRANYWFRSDPGVDLDLKIIQRFTAKNVVELFASIEKQLAKP